MTLREQHSDRPDGIEAELIGQSFMRPAVRTASISELMPSPDQDQAHVIATNLSEDWNNESEAFDAFLGEHTNSRLRAETSGDSDKPKIDGPTVLITTPGFRVVTPSGFPADVQSMTRISQDTRTAKSWANVNFPFSKYEEGDSREPVIAGLSPTEVAKAMQEYRELALQVAQWEASRLARVSDRVGYSTTRLNQRLEIITLGVSGNTALREAIQAAHDQEEEEGDEDKATAATIEDIITGALPGLVPIKEEGSETKGNGDPTEIHWWGNNEISVRDVRGYLRRRGMVFLMNESPELVQAIGVGSDDDTNGDLAYRAGIQTGRAIEALR